MGKDDKPRIGTRIFKHGKGADNPSRGVTEQKASRTLKASSQGKNVDPARVKAAKDKAKDHYAQEVDEATRKSRRR